MKPPKTIYSLCASLFIFMGFIFVFAGIIFDIADIPVNNGSAWSFILIGSILFLAGFVCMIKSYLHIQRIKYLKLEGISVIGKILSVRHLIWINWNTKTFVNYPGQCSPWIIVCSYDYKNQTYTVKSTLSWLKPSSVPQQPIIYLDPSNPSNAYIDMDTVKWDFL